MIGKNLEIISISIILVKILAPNYFRKINNINHSYTINQP